MIKTHPAKVSILMSVFNAEETLPFCLDCIFSQTLQECELIAMNDGAMGKSVELLQSCEDARICLVENGRKGMAWP